MGIEQKVEVASYVIVTRYQPHPFLVRASSVVLAGQRLALTPPMLASDLFLNQVLHQRLHYEHSECTCPFSY